MKMSKECAAEDLRNLPVTQYHLSGEEVRIVFHDGSEETAMLEYNGQVFRGPALGREQTALGLVVSVPLETIPDLYTVSLNVVVPPGNRPSTDRSITVSTFAVLATERTSIAGPALVSGQILEYKLVPLTGNAS
jgi:hypothetical protein